jgi:hypothetical protein
LGVTAATGAAEIVRIKRSTSVPPPPSPATPNAKVPVGAPHATERVIVLLPLPGAGIVGGEKRAVTPPGSAFTDNATAELNPFIPTVDTVFEIEPPCSTVALNEVMHTTKLDGIISTNRS